MKRLIIWVFVLTAVLSASAVLAQAQEESPLTPVSFEKLRLLTLDEKRSIQLPTGARKALGLPDIRMNMKQLVAGEAKKKYFLMVRTDSGTDDVVMSLVTDEFTFAYLTNSKLKLRGAAASIQPGVNVSVMDTVVRGGVHGALAADGVIRPLSLEHAAEGFKQMLQAWAEVAEGL